MLGGYTASNDSIAGSCVASYSSNDDGDLHLGPLWRMNSQSRVSDLGSTSVSNPQHPTRFFFFGGTNDLCQHYTNPAEAAFYGTYNVVTFYSHYIDTLHKIYNTYTYNPTVMCITPYKSELIKWDTDVDPYAKFNEMCYYILMAVTHFRQYGYDCKIISLQDIELSGSQLDGSYHPN